MVICKECLQEKKSLPAHLRHAHQMSVAEYTARHGEQDMGYTWGKAKSVPRRTPPTTRDSSIAPSGIIDDFERGLTVAERAVFNKNYSILFEAADRDPVLEQTIKEVCMNQVFIYRYQKQLQQQTKIGEMNPQVLAAMHKMLKDLQDTTIRQLDSLNLTKAKRDAAHKTVETTPSRMIANLALTMSRFSPHDEQRMKEDIEKAMDLLNKHEDELKELLPSEEATEKVEEIKIE